jgi:tetratricopeptide (TPR) repeat protein
MLKPSPINRGDSDRNLAALVSRADADFAEQNLAEAIKGYSRILDLQPQNLHALHCAGLACFSANQIARAREFLGRATRLAPDRADILEQNGLLAAFSNDCVEAEAYYRRALEVGGGTASLHRNLADVLRTSQRLEEAVSHFAKSLEIEPGLHHAARALAEIFTEIGRFSASADYWLRAWALDSSNLSDGLALIVALAKARRNSECDIAVAELRSACASDSTALNRLAQTLNGIQRFREAISVAKQGLAIDPKNDMLHVSAIYAFSFLVDHGGLVKHCTEAVELLPDNAFIQFMLANLELKSGDFERGFRRLKWYEKTPVYADVVRSTFPGAHEWTGEPVKGCRFLLVKELGLGDQIQFLRLADWLHGQGATVDVWVDTSLAALARNAKGVHTVWTEQPPGPYDHWCSMLRAPEYMKLDVSMLPLGMPYVSTTSNKLNQWQIILDRLVASGASVNRRVALVWAGNPKHPTDRHRSVRLDTLRPLFAQPGITWFSVQKGELERQSEGLANEFDFHTLGPAISDFSDTLAVLQLMDLVITVDTSVAHLAGAAGLPVWVLVSRFSDWRWLIDRTDSPWYPSMRLFRQRELGHWGAVIDEVQDALRAWCAAPGRLTSLNPSQ